MSRRFFVAGIVIEGSIRASTKALKRFETKEMGQTTLTHWKKQNLGKIGIGFKSQPLSGAKDMVCICTATPRHDLKPWLPQIKFKILQQLVGDRQLRLYCTPVAGV